MRSFDYRDLTENPIICWVWWIQWKEQRTNSCLSWYSFYCFHLAWVLFPLCLSSMPYLNWSDLHKEQNSYLYHGTSVPFHSSSSPEECFWVSTIQFEWCLQEKTGKTYFLALPYIKLHRNIVIKRFSRYLKLWWNF